MKRETKKRLITIFILITFLGSSVTYAIISAIPSGETPSTWMARVVILINEQEYPIPLDLGIVGNQSVGKVYSSGTEGIILKSASGDVTVKDFFDTWGKNFNQTCILDYCNTNTSSVAMFVNGKANFEYQYYVIKSQDVIIIDYR
jgi:hypothetical protein